MTENSPNLRQILQHAVEVGHQRQAARVERVSTLMGEGRQLIRDAIRRAKEGAATAVKKVGDGILAMDALVGDPQVRGQLKDWGREQIRVGAEKTQDKGREIWHKFNQKREELTDRATGKIREIRTALNQEIVQPGVAKAKEVGTKVIDGAKTAGLFAVSVAVAPARGAYELGKAGVEVGKQGVETGKQKIGEGVEAAKEGFHHAVEKARDWRDRFTGFVIRQADNIGRGIQTRWNEVLATANDVLAVPQELQAGLKEKLAQKLVAGVENHRQIAQQRRERAQAIRNGANVSRNG
jgi:hypothetical protein